MKHFKSIWRQQVFFWNIFFRYIFMSKLGSYCIKWDSTLQCYWSNKVVLFPEIGWVIFFLSLTRPVNRMCIRIYKFDFKKQQANNSKKTRTKKRNKQNLSKRNKRNFAAARLKILLVTRISGNKSIIFLARAFRDKFKLYFSYI